MNSKDPIEDLFKQNQNGFDETPRIEIWDKIESKLEEREQRAKGIYLWWKYAAAAIVVLGLSFGLWSINQTQSKKTTPQSIEVVLEPIQKTLDSVELNDENKTHFLDQIETNQPTIAFEHQHIIKQPKHTQLEIKSDEPTFESENLADSNMISAETIANKDVENSPISDAKSKSAQAKPVTASATIIDSEKIDTRRFGNSAIKNYNYDHKLKETKINSKEFEVPVQNKIYIYHLIDHTNDVITLKNEKIKFPSTIKLHKQNDSIFVEYFGNENRQNNKKSKLVQKYFNQKKSEIFEQISDQ